MGQVLYQKELQAKYTYLFTLLALKGIEGGREVEMVYLAISFASVVIVCGVCSVIVRRLEDQKALLEIENAILQNKLYYVRKAGRK